MFGLLLARDIVGLLVKKQMAAARAPLPSLAPAASAPTTVRAQSQQVQQQVKEAMDAAMQQQRAMPDDAK